jgi:hypothetical protein
VYTGDEDGRVVSFILLNSIIGAVKGLEERC